MCLVRGMFPTKYSSAAQVQGISVCLRYFSGLVSNLFLKYNIERFQIIVIDAGTSKPLNNTGSIYNAGD